MSETSLENSAPTDSPRWMRLIASPMSGATESVVILGSRLRRRQRDRVGQDDLAQALMRAIRSIAGSLSTPCVAQA